MLSACRAIRFETTHGESTLEISIEQFLVEVEKKAFRMAEIATQNQSDALDIVQDTMIKLVTNYSDKACEQWKPIFYRILQNKINDYFRKRKIYASLFFWKKTTTEDDNDVEFSGATNQICPERELIAQRNMARVIEVLKLLPVRQHQCFMLRNWEGLSVAETAEIMGCSQGSVKTHYSRAREMLNEKLGDLL